VQAPASLAAAAFDSAPGVAFRETGYSSWGSLRPHFWLPLGINAGQAGHFFGAVTAGADALGRYFYLAEAQVSPSPLRLQGSFFLLNNALGNPTLDFSFLSRWSWSASTARATSCRRTGPKRPSAPLSSRSAGVASFPSGSPQNMKEGDSSRSRYEPRRHLQWLQRSRPRRRVGHPLDRFGRLGAPHRLAAGRCDRVDPLPAQEEQGNARFLNEVRARGNLYLRLGPRVGFASSVLALRGAVGGLDGPITDRFSVGGVSSGGVQFLFGQTVGASRTFPVRGYPAECCTAAVRRRSAPSIACRSH